MIHFDTNLLIAAIDAAHPHYHPARAPFASGKPVSASAVAWTELLSKSVPALRLQALTALLGSRILPFTKADAEFAGQLFQAPGVKRAQRLDTMIAATAILGGAELATVNVSDFAPFIPFGLKLLGAPKH